LLSSCLCRAGDLSLSCFSYGLLELASAIIAWSYLGQSLKL
jgi:hypothetical protein